MTETFDSDYSDIDDTPIQHNKYKDIFLYFLIMITFLNLISLIIFPIYKTNEILNRIDCWLILYIILHITVLLSQCVINYNTEIIEISEEDVDMEAEIVKKNKNPIETLQLILFFLTFSIFISSWVLLLVFDTREEINTFQLEKSKCITNTYRYNISFDECDSDNINCLKMLNINSVILSNKTYNCNYSKNIMCEHIINHYNIESNECANISNHCYYILNNYIDMYTNSRFVC